MFFPQNAYGDYRIINLLFIIILTHCTVSHLPIFALGVFSVRMSSFSLHCNSIYKICTRSSADETSHWEVFLTLSCNLSLQPSLLNRLLQSYFCVVHLLFLHNSYHIVIYLLTDLFFQGCELLEDRDWLTITQFISVSLGCHIARHMSGTQQK